MSYGLQIKSGANNDITIADTGLDMINYVPVEHGFGTKTTVDVNLIRDLVFIKYNPSYGDVVSFQFRYSSYDTGVPNPLYEVDSNGDPTFATLYWGWTPTIWANETNLTFLSNKSTQVAVEYIVLKPAADVTNPVGDYGLQIYNKENRVLFDSRALTSDKNIVLKEYIPPRSMALLVGQDGVIYREDKISSSFSDFYSMNDNNSVYSIGVISSGSTSRSLVFSGGGTNNYVVGGVNNTLPAGVYAQQISTTTGLFGTVFTGYELPDFIVFRGSLIQ